MTLFIDSDCLFYYCCCACYEVTRSNEWQQTLHPKNIDFKLERIKSVYKKLNIKKIANKVIIVAGTNGKGSTVAILESILYENNFSVGTFTSPHIRNYNERIRINKKEVCTDSLQLV